MKCLECVPSPSATYNAAIPAEVSQEALALHPIATSSSCASGGSDRKDSSRPCSRISDVPRAFLFDNRWELVPHEGILVGTPEASSLNVERRRRKTCKPAIDAVPEHVGGFEFSRKIRAVALESASLLWPGNFALDVRSYHSDSQISRIWSA